MKQKKKLLKLVKNDSWLEPYNDAIQGRHDHVLWKLNQLTQDGKISLSDFADGHLYFGLHRTARKWIFREWAPNATKTCRHVWQLGDKASFVCYEAW